MRQRSEKKISPLHTRGVNLMKQKFLYKFLTVCLAMSLTSITIHQAASATPMAQLNADKDVVTLEFEEGGHDIVRNFPLHEKGSIRYFSAGVGKLERKTAYPAFPLKLVFAYDSGAFLAHISVEIHNNDGSLAVKIPAKHVMGPWLFVDLDPGVYEIVATNQDGEKVAKRVPVKKNDPLSLPLYWHS